MSILVAAHTNPKNYSAARERSEEYDLRRDGGWGGVPCRWFYTETAREAERRDGDFWFFDVEDLHVCDMEGVIKPPDGSLFIRHLELSCLHFELFYSVNTWTKQCKTKKQKTKKQKQDEAIGGD